MPSDTSTAYVNSVQYTDWQTKIKDISSVMSEMATKSLLSRKLRYAEVDQEVQRTAGKLAPDELYVPQHIIDTNIRREQTPYIQYVTQSNRAVILQDALDLTLDTSVIEHEVTSKLRYTGWQKPMYALIDGFQQDGFGIFEVVQDQTKEGAVAHEFVPLGDFGFTADSRDIQECEIVARAYYFSITRLLEMSDPEAGSAYREFDREQIEKIVNSAASKTETQDASITDNKDKSLRRIFKVMFRVKGTVHVAWVSDSHADNWLRKPRPLYLGRRSAPKVDIVSGNLIMDPENPEIPLTEKLFETRYPYQLYPYQISENATISQLKGRVYLDQDTQEAASSLMSSSVTAYRRAAMMIFSKNTDDPADDVLSQKQLTIKHGAIINSKVSQFQLIPPDAGIFSAIQMIVTANQQETSQINFAAQNRKDSRKTAEEIRASTQQGAALSTVQVVLFSTELKETYTLMLEIIQSRVVAGLIKVGENLMPLYKRSYIVKPAGDTDVIERQQLINQMMQAWDVIQNTPANVIFLCDLLSKMFPEQAAKYIQVIQQSQQQQQTQQAQMQQQMMQQVQQLAMNVVALSKKPEMFSDTGKIHALPAVQAAAQQIEQVMQQTNNVKG